MRFIAIILLLLSGCYTPVTHIGGVEKDEFLKTHFTPEAYEIAKDIPIVEGWIAPGLLAAGTNFWSSVGSFFIGCGVGAKVIVTQESMNADNAAEYVIHEYIHHFHDMTLDGDGYWINKNEFENAYLLCSMDSTYAGIVIMTEAYANHWVTNIFGLPDNSEYMAYAGARAHQQGGPAYLQHVYRRFLKPVGKKE